mmetsp:Transcript_7164/g.6256  ORF Transcript_7164/g.6256 Transcript_7164/m.6256 type:complete len:102 (-) Transcript_7164:307-612(-)
MLILLLPVSYVSNGMPSFDLFDRVRSQGSQEVSFELLVCLFFLIQELLQVRPQLGVERFSRPEAEKPGEVAKLELLDCTIDLTPLFDVYLQLLHVSLLNHF